MNIKYGRISVVSLLVLAVCGMLIAATPDQKKSRYLTMLGIQAQTEKNMAEAAQYFQRALELNPDNHEAAYNFGWLTAASANDTNDVKTALRLMRQYVEAYPDDKTEGNAYAFLARESMDIDEAIRVTKRLADTYPDDSELILNLAMLETMKGNFAASRDWYNRYEALEGLIPEIATRRMGLWLADHDTVNAIAEVDRLIAERPADPDMYVLKGNLYSYLERPDSAYSMYKLADKIAPDNGGVRMAMVNYFSETADSAAYDEAVYRALLSEDIDLEVKVQMLADYVVPILDSKTSTARADYLLSTLREQYPHEADIQDFSARYSAAKQDWQNAVDQIQVAIDMDPSNKSYLFQKVTYLLPKGDYNEVISICENEEKNDTTLSSIDFSYYGTLAYSASERNDKVLERCDMMLHRIFPDAAPIDTLSPALLLQLNEKGRNMLGNIYTMKGDTRYKLKDYDGMKHDYEMALLANPEDAMTLNNYAFYICESGGDIDKALEMAKEAIAIRPDSSTILDTYAWILFKKGEYKEALKYQESAIENAEDEELTYDFYDHYGDILFMNKRPTEALEQWKKALQMNRDDKLLQKKVKYKTYFYE